MLILAPDLSMLGYLLGSRAGALTYNVAHTTVLPLALGVVGAFSGWPVVVALALIWLAHVGIDRMLGYGLKYPDRFGHTHLGSIGPR